AIEADPSPRGRALLHGPRDQDVLARAWHGALRRRSGDVGARPALPVSRRRQPLRRGRRLHAHLGCGEPEPDHLGERAAGGRGDGPAWGLRGRRGRSRCPRRRSRSGRAHRDVGHVQGRALRGLHVAEVPAERVAEQRDRDRRRGGDRPRHVAGVHAVIIVGSAGGWISAIGGAWKDAPHEGFHLFKFFRSPLVALTYAMLLAALTRSYVFIAMGALGYTVATLETHKTFFKPNVP